MCVCNFPFPLQSFFFVPKYYLGQLRGIFPLNTGIFFTYVAPQNSVLWYPLIPLQKTHLVDQKVLALKKPWVGWVFYTSFSTHSRKYLYWSGKTYPSSCCTWLLTIMVDMWSCHALSLINHWQFLTYMFHPHSIWLWICPVYLCREICETPNTFEKHIEVNWRATILTQATTLTLTTLLSKCINVNGRVNNFDERQYFCCSEFSHGSFVKTFTIGEIQKFNANPWWIN